MKRLLIITFLMLSFGSYSQENYSLVNVTGKGMVTVAPDRVLIKARIEYTGKSAAEVKTQNDKIVNEVIRYLKSQDIPSKNIQTDYINLNKDYNYNSKETFYSANQAISILLEDIGRYEKVMSGLMESGLNRIDGIQFKTSRKEALESQARKMAILDAKEKAEEYAQPLGQEVGRAHSINELNSGDFPPMYRAMEMKASDSAEGQSIAPGEIEITVKVNVGFFLK